MLKCKNCGIKYDGPPDEFPKSGLCPWCSLTPEEKAAWRAWRAEADRLEREREEADREAWVGVEY